MTTVQPLLAHIKAGRQRHVQLLEQLLRIPSVSTDPQHSGDVRKACEFAAELLEKMDFIVSVHNTPGHPIVFAHHIGKPDAPTGLSSGHLDVQPAEQSDGWDSPPFEPDVRDGFIYARGAADDKGQILAHMLAVEAHLAVDESLPLNVKFLLEAEEEIGSPHLEQFLATHRDVLKANWVVISDTSQFAAGVPAITYGLRGLASAQITVHGPNHDLHSGSFGGTVANPANALAHIIAALKSPEGKITIPGFYEDVAEPSQQELDEWTQLPLNVEQYKQMAGVEQLCIEQGYNLLHARWARPTLDVNAIAGGFAGAGVKTIIPAIASAKVSMRLVPNQDPHRILTAFEQHVKRVCPPGVKVQVESTDFCARPVLVDRNSDAIRAAVRAIEVGFGRKPVMIREGGTIPVVSSIQQILQEQALLIGFSRPDDNAHGPNERFNLDDFQRAIITSAVMLIELAKTR